MGSYETMWRCLLHGAGNGGALGSLSGLLVVLTASAGRELDYISDALIYTALGALIGAASTFTIRLLKS